MKNYHIIHPDTCNLCLLDALQLYHGTIIAVHRARPTSLFGCAMFCIAILINLYLYAISSHLNLVLLKSLDRMHLKVNFSIKLFDTNITELVSIYSLTMNSFHQTEV